MFVWVIIIFLISSSNHILYCFWDLLGLVSFFLVIFYNNFISLKGSLETLIRNRLGDLFLLVFVRVSFFYSLFFNLFYFFVIFFLVSSLVKRAQFPFIGWLPRAIAAPTPVSSLVHRSTLVTAGFFIVFYYGFKINFYCFLLFFLGLVSISFSSFFSLLEKDVKKLVAWRTLSQLGLCFVFFSLGRGFFGFLHLISHAFFKSSLFLLVGFFIFYNKSQQDFRFSLVFFFSCLLYNGY